MPKLSIITINFNNFHGLEKTFKSVLNQTYLDYEYIIIDGGSSDGSKNFIEMNTSSVSYWVSEKDNGIYHAMNKGIRKAKGTYLLFLNSGDYFLHADVCSQMLENADEWELIYGNVQVKYPGGKLDHFAAPEKLSLPFLFTGSLFHPATFIHHKLFEKFGLYDEDLKIVSDWSFIFKIVATGQVKSLFKNIDVSMYHKDGISSDPGNACLIQSERQAVIAAILPSSTKELIKENEGLKKQNEFFNSLFSSRKKVIRYLLSTFISSKNANES